MSSTAAHAWYKIGDLPSDFYRVHDLVYDTDNQQWWAVENDGARSHLVTFDARLRTIVDSIELPNAAYCSAMAYDSQQQRLVLLQPGISSLLFIPVTDYATIFAPPRIVDYGSRWLGFLTGCNKVAFHDKRNWLVFSSEWTVLFVDAVSLCEVFRVHPNDPNNSNRRPISDFALDTGRDRIVLLYTDIDLMRMVAYSIEDLVQCLTSPWLCVLHDRAMHLSRPRSMCIDNLGRIIVRHHHAINNKINDHLSAWTPDLKYISRWDLSHHMHNGVAFSVDRGTFGLLSNRRLPATHIMANSWLDFTFSWTPNRQRFAPSYPGKTVLTVTMIRSLVHESPLAMLPNELLFLIFQHL